MDGNDTDFELFEMMLFDEIVNKSSDRIGLFVADQFRPCRTTSPRRECKGRNHPHPQLLPTHPKAWRSLPWELHHL